MRATIFFNEFTRITTMDEEGVVIGFKDDEGSVVDIHISRVDLEQVNERLFQYLSLPASEHLRLDKEREEREAADA